MPAGRPRPSAHKTRIASKPERAGGLGFPSGYLGVGVVERAKGDSGRKFVEEGFLLRPSHEDIIEEMPGGVCLYYTDRP